LRTIEETSRASHNKIKAGIPSGIDFIEQLPERIQSLFSGIGAHALERFDLIKHKNQARSAAVAQDRKQTGKEMHRAERIEVSLHASGALHSGGDIWLAAQPGCGFR
jgi:hypothetical protein